MAIDFSQVITLSEYANTYLEAGSEALELFQKKQRLEVNTDNIKNKWLKIKEPSMLYISKYDIERNNELYVNALPTKEAALIVKRENHDEIVKNNDELYITTNGSWKFICSAIDDNFSSGGTGNANAIIDDVENITEYDSTGKVIVNFVSDSGEIHYADKQGDLYIFDEPFTGTVEYVTQ